MTGPDTNIWVNPRGHRCPKCGRRGLHFADHPHALGFKDYGTIECRFCHARFSNRRAP